ncbi:hypothetical protein [Sulfurospirillum deleyianum]|uniref:Uncharacterized protein n=1 Tax=Sulfurospirillum deleyianum (strain ATCC 51133 / DSM 6946 / 5175) TaxID=525898 RepID=D1B2V9_SULD5|nr:hypothetical protein [Sulfurospirillum deleyianum]ACZ12429.1 conserved hypothetical protein [Sulfurospirillum deleyianum DSM 6946]
MKLLIVVSVFVCHSLYAYSYNDVLKDYQAKRYEKVCSDGAEFYLKNERNEQILVAIGDACAKVDAIQPLSYISKNLISTKEYRESASYFTTLMLQKKLIYQFMHDAINLKELLLPRTDHVLSRVFEELSKGNYKVVEKRIEIGTPQMNYLLWLSDDEPKRVYIDEHKEGKLVQRHWYL